MLWRFSQMKKLSIVVTLSILMSLMIAGIAFANFTTITGTVLDSKTTSPWIYGGTVKVYDCSDSTATALPVSGSNPATIAVDGTFTIAGLSDPSAFRPLCVEFNYSTATSPNGTPATETRFIADQSGDSGTHNMGTIYTDTGPTAVTLADFNPTPSSSTLPVIAAAFFALSSVSFVMLRRRRQIA
jgi:hypothetical protein